MITQTKLKRYLTYNPCTGLFKWKISNRNRWFSARYAGSINADGYNTIKIEGKTYNASRLAWLYIYGEWPNIIDHINRERSYNSIWNLANGTLKDNSHNSISYLGGRRYSLYKTGSRLRYNKRRS